MLKVCILILRKVVPAENPSFNLFMFSFCKKLSVRGASFADNIVCLFCWCFITFCCSSSTRKKAAQEKSICCRWAAHPSLSGWRCCCYLFFACGCQLHIKCGRLRRARARVCALFIALARSLKHIKERRKALYWCKYQFANNIVCGNVQY